MSHHHLGARPHRMLVLRSIWISVFFLLTFTSGLGCQSYGGIQVLSLKDNDLTNISQLECEYRTCILSKGKDNHSFWGITRNSERNTIIALFDIDGTILETHTLSFYVRKWPWEEFRIYIPETNHLIYVESGTGEASTVYQYDIHSKKKSKLVTFRDIFSYVKIYKVNDKTILLAAYSDDRTLGKIVCVDINERKIISQIRVENGTFRLLGISPDGKYCLVSTHRGINDYPLLILNLASGCFERELVSNQYHCSYAEWSPNGKTIVYNLLSEVYYYDLDDSKSESQFLFDVKKHGKDCFLTYLRFISNDEIIYIGGVHISNETYFIRYNFRKKTETDRISIFHYASNLMVMGDYIVWER
jgi:Tol biopolymer transport system component